MNGFDDKGNKFTTLQGLPMIWSGIGKHLQKISPQEANLKLPDVMDNGNSFATKTNNPLPVKGTWTGQEDVTVRIDTNLNRAHQGCKEAKASLFVVMQLQLVPRTLYAAKCCQARFDLITTSHNELDLDKGNIKMDESYSMSTELYRHRINIPHDQYQFKLYDTESNTGTLQMKIAQSGILTTAHINERGKLMVEDKVTSHESIENTADGRIYVVDTHTIFAEVIKYKQLKLRPNSYYQRKDDMDWYLTVNEDYFIRLTLMDRNGNSVCVRDLHQAELEIMDISPLINMKSWRQQYICSMIEWQVEIIDNNNNVLTEKEALNKYGQIKRIKKRENEFLIKPTTLSQFTLRFSATGKSCTNPVKLASSTKKVIVTSNVYFRNTSSIYCPNSEQRNPTKLALLPYTDEKYTHRAPIFFEGGSGRYRLEINDTSVAQLINHDIKIGQDNKNIVIQGRNLGHTYLFVIDYFNPDNFKVLDIEVAFIGKFYLDMNVPREILLHESIQVPLIIRDQYNRRFSSLDGIKQVINFDQRLVHTQKRVNVEFTSLSINDLINEQINIMNKPNKKDAKQSDEITKNVATNVVTKLQKMKKDKAFKCDNCDGILTVRGMKEGYDVFVATLFAGRQRQAKMFVSVYKEIVPIHKAVAIAININDPYTMKWNYGPLPWPTDISKDETRFDEDFLNKLEVDVPYKKINVSNDATTDKKDFSVRYNGKTLEFICYQEFHYTVQLTVKNKAWDTLPFPVESVANVEIFCFPQFKFNSSKIEMGVGTRKKAQEFYPKWVSSPAAQEFNIKLNQNESEVVSIVNSANFVAKRLGSSVIYGELYHSKQRVHIHPPGFFNKLQIIVLFKDFSMEMSAYWIINGKDQIAHIEGLDESHHILPFRHNFDDVFVEWTSEDANIIELLPILPRPNTMQNQIIQSDEKRNNIGTGLSVKLMAHSVGQVNIKATIKLRNPPKRIKAEFQITKTVTVIPQVVHSCNSIILKPNSTLPLSARFNPDTTVAGIGQIYQIKTESEKEWIYVADQSLKVDKNAPPGENIAVTFLLQSPNKQIPHIIKQYPLTQAASWSVSIVEPTGLNLLRPGFIENNAIYSQSVDVDTNNVGTGGQQFWAAMPKMASSTSKTDYKYSKTDNILCEKQNVSLKISILDELARNLHVMDQVKVVSNDTTIVLPGKDITIREETIGGPMYATVQLDALQPGFATITFREKDVISQKSNSAQSQSSEIYVYDDPEFLRTFLTIRVVSTSECESQFGVIFTDQTIAANDTIKFKTPSQFEMDKTVRMEQDNNYKNGKNWQAQTAKSLPASKTMIAVVLIFALVLIILFSWGCGIGDIFTNNNQFDNNAPAQWNPYAQVEELSANFDSPFRNNQSRSFTSSQSFSM